MSKLTLGAVGAVAVALAGFTVSAPAVAKVGPGQAGVSMRISYADLNLASPAGHSALKRRVWRGIHNMCRGEEISYQPTLQDVKCRTAAWTQAAPQIEQAVQRGRVASAGAAPAAASAIMIAVPSADPEARD